jgi:hypothetical protein
VSGQSLTLEIFDSTTLSVLGSASYVSNVSSTSPISIPLVIPFNGPLTVGDAILVRIINATTATASIAQSIFGGFQIS